MKRIMLALAMVLCLYSSAQAGTYYVATRASVALNMADEGATAWTNATSGTSPCSTGTAMLRAESGDTVYFKGGTYEVAPCYVEGPYIPTIYPCNDGTSDSNRITFANAPGETPIINNGYTSNPGEWWNVCGDGCGETTSQMGGAILGAFNNSYVTIKGFKTTGTVLGGGMFVQGSDHVIIEDCELVGQVNTLGEWGVDYGNYDGLRIYQSEYIEARNNLIHDFMTSDNFRGGGVKFYYVYNTEIHHNTIYGENTGIYDKYDGRYNTFHHNFIYNLDPGGSDGYSYGIGAAHQDSEGTGYNSLNAEFYNNVVVSYDGKHCLAVSDSGLYGINWKIYNNTCYNGSSGDGDFGIWCDRCTSPTAWNNIVYNFTSTISGVVDSYSHTTNPYFSNAGGTLSTDYRLTGSTDSTVKTGGRGGDYAIYKGAWNPAAEMWIGYCAAGISNCDVYGDTTYGGGGGTTPGQGCTISGGNKAATIGTGNKSMRIQ